MKKDRLILGLIIIATTCLALTSCEADPTAKRLRIEREKTQQLIDEAQHFRDSLSDVKYERELQYLMNEIDRMQALEDGTTVDNSKVISEIRR